MNSTKPTLDGVVVYRLGDVPSTVIIMEAKRMLLHNHCTCDVRKRLPVRIPISNFVNVANTRSVVAKAKHGKTEQFVQYTSGD